MNFIKIKKFVLLVFLALFWANTCMASSIDASLENEESVVAPGDFLTVSVKLVNFGSQNRVDVVSSYKIFDNLDKEVYSESETVAVDTTASFIKRIHLPQDILPGFYTAKVILQYPYQVDPAESEFQFEVEEEILGVFKSHLILYFIILFIFVVCIIFVTYLFVGRKKSTAIIFHDYSNKPKTEIIYYEILSDIISQMRLRAGDDALEIAKNIPDLEINEKNGNIINIKNNPAKIIALLISRYEELLGQRVSFGLRQK